MPSEMLVTKNIYIPDYKISLASFRGSGILIYSWLDPLLGFCALVLPSKIGYWDTSDYHPPRPCCKHRLTRLLVVLNPLELNTVVPRKGIRQITRKSCMT